MRNAYGPQSGRPDAEKVHFYDEMGSEWDLGSSSEIIVSLGDNWKTSVIVPIFIGKGDVMSCGSYRGVKLLEHAMKIVERVLERRI